METINGAPLAVRYDLPGSYRGNEIQVERIVVPGSNRIFVNLHGTYGIMHGNSWKYGKLASTIAEENLANTVLYSTSRDWKMAAESDGSYEARMESFRGKTFEDELADARSVLADAIANSKRDFGASADELEITLQGSSLGGIIAFYLAAEFPQVKTVITVWTGLRLTPTGVPILSTFPPVEEVRAKLAAFEGKYLLQYGTEDDVFPQESFSELYHSVTGTKDKSFLCYAGVDHSFKSVQGKKSPEVFAKVIEMAVLYLKTGRFCNGTIPFALNANAAEAVGKYWTKAVDAIGRS